MDERDRCATCHHERREHVHEGGACQHAIDPLDALSPTAYCRCRHFKSATTKRRSRHELLANLVSASEIARRIGVGRPAVANWSARGIGFPEPVIRLKYDWREVEAWLLATGRPTSPTQRRHDLPLTATPVEDHRFAPRAWRP